MIHELVAARPTLGTLRLRPQKKMVARVMADLDINAARMRGHGVSTSTNNITRRVHRSWVRRENKAGSEPDG